MEISDKLIPLMREGIEVIKMVLFKKLRDRFAQNHPERDGVFLARLTGAMVNRLFGTPNDQEPFASFAATNRDLIEAELQLLAQTLPGMRIPLTDALRMQTICDLQEGLNAGDLLNQALDLNLLISDRDLPLPHTFMDMARRLGAAFGLIIPPMPAEDSHHNTAH